MENIFFNKNTKKLFEKLKNEEKAILCIVNVDSQKPRVYDLEQGKPLIDFLQQKFPKGFDFVPSFWINEKQIKVENLDQVIEKGDLVTIFPEPQGGFVLAIIINIVVAIVVSFVMKLLFPAKKTNDNDRNYPSLYNSNVRQIEAKKNGPIPYISGVVRCYPQLVTPAFTSFQQEAYIEKYLKPDPNQDSRDAYNNGVRYITATRTVYTKYEDTTYLLCCIGTGEVDVLELYVNNTQAEVIG